MGQNRFRFTLQNVVIGPRETGAVLRWSEQRAGLSEQAIRVLRGSGRRFLRQCFIDHHDEGGEFAQPLKGRFVQHEVEILAGAADGRDIPFVGGALQFEEGFVQTEQTFTQGFEAGAEVGHGTIVS